MRKLLISILTIAFLLSTSGTVEAVSSCASMADKHIEAMQHDEPIMEHHASIEDNKTSDNCNDCGDKGAWQVCNEPVNGTTLVNSSNQVQKQIITSHYSKQFALVAATSKKSVSYFYKTAPPNVKDSLFAQSTLLLI